MPIYAVEYDEFHNIKTPTTPYGKVLLERDEARRWARKMKAERDELEKERQKLANARIADALAITSLNNKLSEMRITNKRIREYNSTLQAENQRLRTQIGELLEENNRYKKQLDELYERINADEDLSELVDLRRRLDELKAERDYWDKCHRVLCRVEIDLRKCITELKAENQRLRTERNEYKADMEQLAEQWQHEAEDNDSLKVENQRKHDAIQALNDQLRYWQDENQRLRELIRQVEWGCDPHDCCPYCGHTQPMHHTCCPAFGDNGILKE